MEFQHIEAPQEGAERTTKRFRRYLKHKAEQEELNLIAQAVPAMSHVRNSLRALQAATRHLSACPETEFKSGLDPSIALSTRATLQLIRHELHMVEKKVLRAEVVYITQQATKRQLEAEQWEGDEREQVSGE